MWKKISLRVRIYVTLTALVFVTFAGGLVMVWYTYQMEDLLSSIIDKNMEVFQTAGELEVALVNQKGFVSYYFLDGDPDWLRQLGMYRRIFTEQLQKARFLVETQQQEEFVKLIESEYSSYVTLKDQVIANYKAGRREAGARLHKEVRNRFFKILQLCEEFKDFQAERTEGAIDRSHAQAENLRLIAGTAMLIVLFLGVLMAFVLVNQILGPVRRLALEADREGNSQEPEDEVKALSRSVHGLIEDMYRTYSELEKSREHLLQAEKMALVGKLAAGMAHSIRNPLTSVKMRLFSLGRNLDLSAPQKEDFEVISEEIRHIDTIVQNFLEFSRPPRLKMQRVSPSDVVDLVIQLMQHRLESYEVEIRLNRERVLPEILIDPEQLKEVLVNILINACEAMQKGGSIVIHEEDSYSSSLGQVAVIRLTDNGPGIPESIRDKVFQPFFTTKEEGTGLGLSIAARIVREHGGRLELMSNGDEGATFVIVLPVKPIK
ncbi:MAG: MCP four helix bundle domain-containing protein [Deltaproteobacteria bacterium]|nr:MCP four helix bundle domain-containing protein [Deltaproteobacteria bacterium]MBW2016498.1 MCP four helix bundle domain-containing protein [Deltaproteobacteria bacterium]MBW2128502.1 MCP four helix bundle domain-containing protein [Deltaproteobacteria bacterium]MBW2303639.1 MCP four helix bundle domain-containing protein [Deltaproteobacteria bacterium]